MLAAAATAKVHRVVLTSSIGALFDDAPSSPKGSIVGPSDFKEIASMKVGDHHGRTPIARFVLPGAKLCNQLESPYHSRMHG